LVALSFASAAYRLPPLQKLSSSGKRLTVVVPAHDEQTLIQRCVRSLFAQSYPRDLFRVVVVADNCSDATAAVAEASGAEVMLRDQPDARGKGHALRWAMDRVLGGPHPWDAIVVVDADSVADSNLLAALAAELDAGAEVVQSDYTLLQGGGSDKSELVKAGFLLFHRVRFTGRARLGMSANLVGNGMLFSKRVLEAHPWDAFTGVEDLEFSIVLRLAGIQPRFAPRARVAGPGPASRSGDVRQRLRWEGGRFHVVRRQLPRLVRTAIVRRDVRLLDAALDLATPPLALLSLLIMGGSVVGAIAVSAGLASSWALAPWIIALAAIPTFVGIGLWAGGASAATWRAMWKAPSFLAWKALIYLRLVRGFDVHRWDRTDRAVEAAPEALRRVDIAGVPVDPVDLPTALARIVAAIGGSKPFQVSTINLDFVVRAQREEGVRNIFHRSDLNVADGAPVVWLGRLLGASIPGRVAGADLVPALLQEAAKSGARIFLLGGEDGVAQAAAIRLRQLNPGLVIAGTFEPPRAAVEDMDNIDILARIAQARPDVLLVAFGHPKQERWIDLHRDQLHVSVAIGVGCVLDIVAGRSHRAPRWMQQAGLEWAYRVGREPRRLFRRYATDAAWLLPIVARTLRSRVAADRIIRPA
jgi:exopolysaccharide biosynthesis WecB/TagA/CpsF family protein